MTTEATIRCQTCDRQAAAGETYFCYWCGEPVCIRCLVRIHLPLATEAVSCLRCQQQSGKNAAADEAMWEVVVEAALAGHDLGGWELTADGRGWEARCRRCAQTVWVGVSGVQYSLLADRCSPEAQGRETWEQG